MFFSLSTFEAYRWALIDMKPRAVLKKWLERGKRRNKALPDDLPEQTHESTDQGKVASTSGMPQPAKLKAPPEQSHISTGQDKDVSTSDSRLEPEEPLGSPCVVYPVCGLEGPAQAGATPTIASPDKLPPNTTTTATNLSAHSRLLQGNGTYDDLEQYIDIVYHSIWLRSRKHYPSPVWPDPVPFTIPGLGPR